MTVLVSGPPVLKITWCVLAGYENSLIYLILQPLTQNSVLMRFDRLCPIFNLELSRFYHSAFQFPSGRKIFPIPKSSSRGFLS
jgi:hypothetical protein